jgi:predicted TIM-barrel fold metal-dependent hydrolase
MTYPSPPEPVIDPDLPIVDSHHHLWLLPEAMLASMEVTNTLFCRAITPVFRRHARYLFDDYLNDLRSGHNVRSTVFVDAHTMYRRIGPEPLRSVGEVEFVNGVAAMAESGLFGDIKVCAGIVGGVDLRLGENVDEVLTAHIQAGGGRYRGVRSPVAYSDDPSILGFGAPGVLLDSAFRRGYRRLQHYGLSFDAFVLEPQLSDLLDLACAFPDTLIILNHLGGPVGIGRYAGDRKEVFHRWRDRITTLARCPNVFVKIGGLGIPFAGLPSFRATPPLNSMHLAEEWRPYIESCVEAFGAERCMFESNYPVDAAVGSYAVLWNAFKRITATASQSEKTSLFSGTASRAYRL